MSAARTASNGRRLTGRAQNGCPPDSLHARLRARLPEIEQAALTRIYGISDPTGVDPAYVESLRDSVSVALDYALEAIERGEERTPPPPPALFAQARLAARNGVGLDTVLRRYLSGYTLIGDFLADEAEQGGLPAGAVPARLLRGCAAVFDRLIAAVSEEYEREAGSCADSSEQRRLGRVERLLDGELLDASDLGYELAGNHLAVLAYGALADQVLRNLATAIDARSLLVRRDEREAWLWLGSRRKIDAAQVFHAADASDQTALAIGEPSEGLSGWRLTHRQAAAALPIAQRGATNVVRYTDVSLLASILQDDLLATSLRQLYILPLEDDGNRTALETLRAYFSAGRNVSSTAAALGVSRNTVATRLQRIETVVGCSVEASVAEFDLALRLDEFARSRASERFQGRLLNFVGSA